MKWRFHRKKRTSGIERNRIHGTLCVSLVLLFAAPAVKATPPVGTRHQQAMATPYLRLESVHCVSALPASSPRRHLISPPEYEKAGLRKWLASEFLFKTVLLRFTLVNISGYLLTKLEPCITVCQESPKLPGSKIVGCTECSQDDLRRVQFKTPVQIRLIEDTPLHLAFHVLDKSDFLMDRVLTSFKANAQDLVKAPNGETWFYFNGKDTKNGALKVRSEMMNWPSADLCFVASAVVTSKGSTTARSFVLRLSVEDMPGEFKPVYTSEVIYNTTEPAWPAFSMNDVDLCNCLYDRRCAIELLEWQEGEIAGLVGRAEMTVSELLSKHEHRLELMRRKPLVNRFKLAAVLTLRVGISPIKKHVLLTIEGSDRRPNVSLKFSFLDLIHNDHMRLNMIIGVDFSISNGHPEDAFSLHYCVPGGQVLNPYQRVLQASTYIHSKYGGEFPVAMFGFGACPKRGKSVSHCFPLRKREDGKTKIKPAGSLPASRIAEVYVAAVQTVSPSVPSCLTPMLSTAVGFASTPTCAETKEYTLLILITDGEIADMEHAIGSMIEASSLPLSIVIVIVGKRKMPESMKRLDPDVKTPLSINGVTLRRNIVHTVLYHSFAEMDVQVLAASMVEHLANNTMEYFHLRHKKKRTLSSG